MLTNVADSSGRGNNGSLVLGASGNTSTTTVPGKLGQALLFDGVDDYVNISNVGFFSSIRNATISMWVYAKNNTANRFYTYQAAVPTTAYFLHLDILTALNNKLRFNLAPPNVSITSNSAFPVNIWQHVIVQCGDDGMKMYINSILQTSTNATTNCFDSIVTPAIHALGKTNYGSNTFYFNGFLDDVRVYNRALSAGEITQLYNLGAASKLASTPRGLPGQGLNSGLVGHWTFDGPKMLTNVADSSGQGNNGSLVGQTSTTTVPGKLGQALSFDGVDDYVNIPHNNILNPSAITISFWANMETVISSNNTLIEKNPNTNNLRIRTTSNKYQFITNAGTNNLLANTAFSFGKWEHWVFSGDGSGLKLYRNGIIDNSNAVAYTASASSGALGIGGIAGGFWANKVKMDDVRIYNRALSASEITQLYNIGAASKLASTPRGLPGQGLNSGLVGHWTFDGPKMLTNVADSSGQGNNGSLVGQTSTTTVPGKLGQALSFDGVNDYVQLGDMTSLEGSAYATWSFWVKPVYSDYDTVFLSKGASAWHISVPNSGLGAGANKFRVIIAGGSFPVVYTNITATVINNVWQHFTVVYDGTQSTNTTKVKIYKNGVLLTNVDSVGTIPTTLPANATNATIGASSLGVNGTMDDVRIYNRVLSATEITQLYNLGR